MSDSFVAPMYSILPGSSVHGISQAKILEWVAIFLLQVIFLMQELNLSPALAGEFFTSELPGKPQVYDNCTTNSNVC